MLFGKTVYLGNDAKHINVLVVSLDGYCVYVLIAVFLKVSTRNLRILRMRWAGHVARMGEDRDVHRVLVGKPEGKRPLGRPRRRWEDSIKMDLQGSWRGSWGLDEVGSG